MQNGKLFMISLTLLSSQELKLFFQNCQLVILQLNILLTETFSALVVFQLQIWSALQKQLAVKFKQQLMVYLTTSWENAVNLKKFNLEMKDITCSHSVKTQKL